MKAKFTFHEEYFDAIASIKNEHLRLQVLTAIIEYGIHGRDPTFDDDGACSACFTFVKNHMDKAQNKCEYIRKRRSALTVAEVNEPKILKTNDTTTNFGNNGVGVADKSAVRAQRAMRAIMSAPVKRNRNAD